MPPVLTAAGPAGEAGRARRDAAADAAPLVRAMADTALRWAAEADRRAGSALREVAVDLADGHGSPRSAGGAAGTGPAGGASWDVPPPGTDAATVLAWWGVLGTARRTSLLRRAPEALGNLDGLPPQVRDEANRRVLADRLRELGPVAGCGPGPSGTAQTREALAVLDEQLRRHPGATLLLLDTHGSGRAAVALGDLETADDVAVLVPGMGSLVVSALPGLLRDAQRLRLRAEGLSSGERQVATVAWIGYRAPGVLTVSRTGRAQLATGPLRGTLRGLHTRTQASGRDLHLTLLGHSYGSLVAGLAVRRPTGTDDLVLLGSPGVLAEQAAELAIPSGHVFVAEADDDPVADLGRFGADPDDSYLQQLRGRTFGAVPLGADGGVSPADGSALRPSVGHSDYYSAGTESLHDAAAVVAGRPWDISGPGGGRPAPGPRGWPLPPGRLWVPPGPGLPQLPLHPPLPHLPLPRPFLPGPAGPVPSLPLVLRRGAEPLRGAA